MTDTTATGEKVSYKGWAGIRRAFGTPSALTMAFLGFGCGLPFLLIASQTLSTRLRDVGLELGSIGLISLASFFYLLKFLWAPLIDRTRVPVLTLPRTVPWKRYLRGASPFTPWASNGLHCPLLLPDDKFSGS